MSASRGFAAIPNHIIRDSTLTPATRILYGVIVSYAWSGRVCSVSTGRLCEEAGMGRSAFFEGIATLRDRGLLDIEKRRSANGWKNVYVPTMRGVEIDDDEGGSPDSGRGVVRQADGGSSATRTQKKTKEEEDSEPYGSESLRARDDELPGLAPSPPAGCAAAKTQPKVNRVPVSDEHMKIAEGIVAAFNEHAGTRFTAIAHLVPLVMRIREHPELGLPDHQRIIRHQLAAPWWKGPPGLNVIYGQGALFERAMHAEAAPVARNGCEPGRLRYAGDFSRFEGLVKE